MNGHFSARGIAPKIFGLKYSIIRFSSVRWNQSELVSEPGTLRRERGEQTNDSVSQSSCTSINRFSRLAFPTTWPFSRGWQQILSSQCFHQANYNQCISWRSGFSSYSDTKISMFSKTEFKWKTSFAWNLTSNEFLCKLPGLTLPCVFAWAYVHELHNLAFLHCHRGYSRWSKQNCLYLTKSRKVNSDSPWSVAVTSNIEVRLWQHSCIVMTQQILHVT